MPFTAVELISSVKTLAITLKILYLRPYSKNNCIFVDLNRKCRKILLPYHFFWNIMDEILISVLIGTSINYLIWHVLTCIAVLTRSKHENFLVNGTLVSGVIAFVAILVYVICSFVIWIWYGNLTRHYYGYLYCVNNIFYCNCSNKFDEE